MKTVIIRSSTDFVPFDLTITVESAEDGKQLLRQLDHVTSGDYLTAANALRRELTIQGVL